MKQRLLSICLIVILVLSLGGAAMAASKPENSFIPGRVPAETDAIQSVTPPIHALVLCMVENDLEYSKSDLFTWKSLYYMLSLYGQMDARAELTDDMLILPAETAADYASVLFPDFQGLPPLPAGWDRVIYDARLDQYCLARGDEGLAETVLTGSRNLSGGGLLVDGRLLDPSTGNTLVRFQATLTPNDGMFGYAVADLKLQ